ncbi:MAG: Trm112 family protein [Planctomycetota bacterium]
MIDKELLEILACPATRQPLRMATADELAKANTRIAAGDCANVGGVKVEVALTEALVREDGAVLYPVREDIPVLLIDEGISIAG